MKNNNFLMEYCFKKARITGELCPNSITKYTESIKRFFKTIGDKDFEDLRLEDFENFVFISQDKGNSNRGILGVIHAMKWIMRKLQDGGHIKRHLDLDKIIKPKIGKKDVNYLTKDEIKKFFELPEKELKQSYAIRKLRVMALFIFLLESGARISEALSVKVKDINFERREVPIIGKGNKPRDLLFGEKSEKWIREYLKRRMGNSEYLFVTLSGNNKWSYNDVCRSFQRYKRLSGIKKNFTIHTFRHTFATQLLLNGAPMNTVKFFLGHANVETTMKYYIGAITKEEAREFRQDKYFDFMPRISVENKPIIS